MKIVVVPILVVAGLLLIALLLPSKRDTSVAAWWARVRMQMNFWVRAVVALACVAGIVWYVLLPLWRWRAIGR